MRLREREDFRMKKIMGVWACVSLILIVSKSYASTIEIPYALKSVTAEKVSEDKLSIEVGLDSVNKRNMKN